MLRTRYLYIGPVGRQLHKIRDREHALKTHRGRTPQNTKDLIMQPFGLQGRRLQRGLCSEASPLGAGSAAWLRELC